MALGELYNKGDTGTSSIRDVLGDRGTNHPHISPLSPKLSLMQIFRKNSKHPWGGFTSQPRKSGGGLGAPTEPVALGDDGKDKKERRRGEGSFRQIQIVPKGHTFQVMLPSELGSVPIWADAIQ